MNKHTPGLWKAEHSGTGDASVICKFGWINKDGTKFEPVMVKRIGWEDARLIATAPELLEACRGALAALTQNKTFLADIEAAKQFLTSAVTRATGGQNDNLR
jgi:hypothetical protein